MSDPKEPDVLNDELIVLPEEREAKLVPTAVSKAAELVEQSYKVIRFRGRAMIETSDPYPHFVPLHKDRFDNIAYGLLGGVGRSRMSDTFSYVCNVADDYSKNDHLIGFGIKPADVKIEADTDIASVLTQKPLVWDSRELRWEYGEVVDNCVWRSPYAPIEGGKPIEFIMQLAGNDREVYNDIMQSIAPLVMERKPDGVIWWIGSGANGKSTLMDAIYKIFPGQLSSLTVKRLTDGRDTPSLNGTLANVVKETSEGRIDDTEIYKSIGTHENFRVHRFHSQDDIEIRGNLHHIFNANIIPSFNDKGYATRRRTFVVPFRQQFVSDPNFEEKTFTPKLFGRLVAEMCKYAQQIKEQGYRYRWSAVTLAAKEEYDAEASNAEEYAKSIIAEGVVAFNSFNPVRVDYENWCADNGYVPLGVGNLRRALQALGFERFTTKEDDRQAKQYRLPYFKLNELQPLGMNRPGLFTTQGFEKKPDEPKQPEKIELPDFPPVDKKPEPKKTILNGKW